MGEDWDSWASITRSCVITSKTPLTPFEINRDTKMLEGRDIPFKAFNYRTLEDMLRKIPGLKVFQANGKIVVQSIPTEQTAHIAKMVRLQKPAKKKPRTIPPVFNRASTGRRSFPNNRTTNNTSYNATNANRNYVPNKQSNSIQNRFNNVPNNSYSRSTSSEPQRRPPPVSHSTPTRSNSFDSTAPKKTSPTPLMQLPITPPSTPPVVQRRRTPPPALSPLLPTPPHSAKSVSFASSIQQRLSPPTTPAPAPVASKQQRLQTQSSPGAAPLAKPNLAQRLSVAQSQGQRSVPAPTLDDPRLRLMSYTEARKLPLPVYKDLPMKNNNILSSVTVDSRKFSSYPQEAKTKDEAEKLAAQAALNDLLKDVTPRTTTRDRALVVKRVLEIVTSHPNGMFESCVVETYVAQFDEGLPRDWLKWVEQAVTVDVGANNLTILSPQTEGSALSSSGSQPTSPSSIVDGLLLTEPELLKLNHLEEFWLHVYVVYGTTDLWGVIIDENHSDKIDELAKEMKIFYDANQSPKTVPSVTPGNYYSVFDSEWHRVRCIKVDPDTQTATVFFIDRGDEDVFPVARLRQLQPKFCRLPAQSVRLSLTGLEAFQNCDETQALLEETLVDKDVFVRSMRFDQRYREEKYMGTVSAQLYLERGEEEVNANELVRQEIMKRIVDPNVKMGTDKISQHAHISHVSEKTIFVQLKSKGLQLLETLMNDLTKDCLSNTYFKLNPVLRFDPTQIYVTKNSEDNKWYRAKIIRILNENEAQVACIDVGNTLTVHRKNLVLLEDLSELLAVYPKQAVQVQLHKISPIMFDKKMASHLRVLAPKKDVFYMKVVGVLEDIAIVEFYKRTEDNYLASLNDTLALEPEIQTKDDNNNAKPKIRNNRSSIGGRTEFPLKAPMIPAVGSFFDVHITMAAHPGNFTVQPLQNVQELEKLMTELSKVCESYSGPSLTPSAVKVGTMYAAKYEDDGRWYRAYISKVISKNVCAVYFCDYGDYRAVSLELLQPLQNQFYDLPYQAIKAKLYGIIPKLKGDWSVKDTLRFNELIVTKNFVSIVKSCDMDNLSSGETVLGLELIDTTTAEDIYITSVLVNEKRAEKLEELKV